jgi:hypothetical protein
MLLGDMIARFDDPAYAGEALMALDDLVLVADIIAAAEAEGLAPGELAKQAVDRFVAAATDEDWVTLIGAMERAEDPGRVFLRRALALVPRAGQARPG